MKIKWHVPDENCWAFCLIPIIDIGKDSHDYSIYIGWLKWILIINLEVNNDSKN